MPLRIVVKNAPGKRGRYIHDLHKVSNEKHVMPNAGSLRMAYEQGDYPYPEKMSQAEYEKQIQLLQAELLKV